MPKENCSTCKYHSAERRNKIGDVAFDDIVEFSDEMETVYRCTKEDGPHARQEIGTKPILCFAYSALAVDKAAALSEADKMLARFEQRHKDRPKEDR